MPYRRRKRKRKHERPVELAVPDRVPDVHVGRDPEHAEISLVLIPQEMVNEVWPLCHKFIADGCATGDMTAEQIKAEAESGSVQLWFAWSDHLEAAAATTIMPFARQSVCLFLSFGGKDMGRWLGLLDEIETWAKMQGATISRTFGRKGWGKVLKDYRPKFYVYEKEL